MIVEKTLVKNIPFYQSFASNDRLEDYPVISKSIVMDNLVDFFDAQYEGPIAIACTSGTTGEILRVKWKNEDYYFSLMQTWKMRKKYGISPGDMYCTNHAFYYDSNDNFLSHKIIIQRNMISVSKIYTDDTTLSQYVETIKKYNAKWLMLQPYFAYELCKYCDRMGVLWEGIKLVELTGEMLPENVKRYIGKIFAAPVANHYGMQEFNTIAYEDDFGNLKVCEKNVCVEILDGERVCSEEEEGEIVVSTKVNSLMPLLRYNSHDRGYLYRNADNELCLKVTNARGKNLLNTDGRVFDSSIFFYLVEYLNSQGESIEKFQFFKKNKKLMCVFVSSKILDTCQLAMQIGEILEHNFSIVFDVVEVKQGEEFFRKDLLTKKKYYYDLEDA